MNPSHHIQSFKYPNPPLPARSAPFLPNFNNDNFFIIKLEPINADESIANPKPTKNDSLAVSGEDHPIRVDDSIVEL